MSLLRRPYRRRVQINIVPLVDVLMVIIFFFLVTMQLRRPRVMNITPPRVETAGENNATQEIVIAVDGGGAFYYNNEAVAQERLDALVALAAGFDSRQRVLVIADEETPLKNVTHVMDVCRREGLEDLQLQTR